MRSLHLATREKPAQQHSKKELINYLKKKLSGPTWILIIYRCKFLGICCQAENLRRWISTSTSLENDIPDMNWGSLVRAICSHMVPLLRLPTSWNFHMRASEIIHINVKKKKSLILQPWILGCRVFTNNDFCCFKQIFILYWSI